MPTVSRVMVCQCARARVLPQATVQATLRRLEAAGIPCLEVDDLCAWSARKEPLLQRFAGERAGVVLACQPRAVRWLFAAAGAPLALERMQLVHLGEPAADELLKALRPEEGAAPGVGPDGPPASAPEAARVWQAWFPVIDFDRCTHCLQCLSFCLFGVFGVSAERRLEVENPESCKPNCPACARVCPEAAIMFPQCPSPAMNGSEIAMADGAREPMKVDISTLLGGDVYERLRARNQKSGPRFSKERDPQTALEERQKYLAEAAREIPPEVLRSLPPAEELHQRALAARERAQAALAAQKSG